MHTMISAQRATGCQIQTNLERLAGNGVIAIFSPRQFTNAHCSDAKMPSIKCADDHLIFRVMHPYYQ